MIDSPRDESAWAEQDRERGMRQQLMMTITLGQLIAIARECKGWSLRDLEKRTDVSHALISQIEHGHVKDPGFRTIVKLADALGLKLDRVAEPIRNAVQSEFARKILRHGHKGLTS